MLLPTERTQAISMLARHYMNQYQYNQHDLQKFFEVGHAGFASYTDVQLLNALHKIKSMNYEIQTFLTNFAAEKFLLE